MRQRRRKAIRDLLEAISRRSAALLFRSVFAGVPPSLPDALGRAGESRVALAYKLLGYRILARNLAIGGGEIDLIVAKGRLVAFVEVKTRGTSMGGRGWEAVGKEKQRQLERLATLWLTVSRATFDDVRFDVVSILWSAEVTEVERYVDAFRPAPVSR